MSNPYPIYAAIAGPDNPCEVHTWQKCDHGQFTNRMVEWFAFSCPHCGIKVRIDVLDDPRGTAKEPEPPPTDHDQLKTILKERSEHRLFE